MPIKDVELDEKKGNAMGSTIYVGKYIDSGSRNDFYHIVGSNKKYGFKQFTTKENAEWSHRVQSFLSQHDAAPMVASEVGRITLEKSIVDSDVVLSDWGYVTEVATKVRLCKNIDCSCDFWTRFGDCPIYQTMAFLTNFMQNNGLFFTDGHIANFGMVKRKNKKVMVLIDCGVEGFDDYDRSVWGYASDSEDGNGYGYNSCSCSNCQRYANMER